VTPEIHIDTTQMTIDEAAQIIFEKVMKSVL
jgi:hypothetical protein